MPFSTADEAWQRAVQLVSQSPLDPQHEPRVKRKPDAPPVNAENPFFWAGYLLVDTGAEPSSDQPKGNDKPLVLKLDDKKKPPDAKPAQNKADGAKAVDKKTDQSADDKQPVDKATDGKADKKPSDN